MDQEHVQVIGPQHDDIHVKNFPEICDELRLQWKATSY